MPRRKRKSKLRPKLPSRVKKTRRKRGARTRNQHPELWGLGSVALGLFLGAVLYFGWNGGYVGGWLGEGLDRVVGDARYVVPVALATLGALVVTRSALVDVRPFRTGLVIVAFFMGRLVGAMVRVGAGDTLSSPARVVLAILISLAGIGAGQLGIWVFSRTEGGVLDVATYLGSFGPLVPLEFMIATLSAWWAAR